ncbi:MAG: acyl-CoA dehydrogenase family protein [Dehalococcoidales bacterium]|nr:MAG: acyl-CoA dehydrogenase family protein [Dehalococcoidales bacterium]
MVSNESAEAEALREEVRAWLVENLPEKWGTPEYVAPELRSEEARELNRSFSKKLYDAGYIGFGLPKEYGGVERPAWERAIIREELARRGTPPTNAGLGRLVVETLMQWGTEEQKKKYIPGIISGQVNWIEGFSEPNAGSDLANVQTTAVRDGDEWIINGQKCWTSGWQGGEWGFLLCRTDLNAPRHRNLSFFLFDCSKPGFSRGPLRQMTGDAQYGELFFDDMRVPHENMVGEEGRGWYVAMTTLIAERGGGQVAAGSGETGSGTRGMQMVRSIGGVDNLIELAKKTKRYGKSFWDDNNFKHRIAQIAIENEARRVYGIRLGSIIRSGKASGNEAVMTKMSSTEQGKRRGDMLMEIIGAYSQLMRGDERAVDEGSHVQSMLGSRGTTIYMGSNEICRNILSERVLGLPRGN